MENKSLLTFMQQQSELNLLLQKQLQDINLTLQKQQHLISSLIESLTTEIVPVVSSPTNCIERNWVPTILYGSIKETTGAFIYTFCRKDIRYPYDSPETRKIAHQKAIDHQIAESLNNGKNNRYYIQDDISHLELRDGTVALVDIADLSIISGKTWYPHKGHVITRVSDKRMRMCALYAIYNNIF